MGDFSCLSFFSNSSSDKKFARWIALYSDEARDIVPGFISLDFRAFLRERETVVDVPFAIMPDAIMPDAFVAHSPVARSID